MKKAKKSSNPGYIYNTRISTNTRITIGPCRHSQIVLYPFTTVQGVIEIKWCKNCGSIRNSVHNRWRIPKFYQNMT